MPSRMLHYYVAEQVLRVLPVVDKNRFKIGSLCPDMTVSDDGSKQMTHFFDVLGNKKGVNWKRFEQEYGGKITEDTLYAGILCHLITDAIWFSEMSEPLIRSVSATKEERNAGYQKGYADYHKLNDILRREHGLTYELKEDRDICLCGIHQEKFEDVFDGMYADFYCEPPAEKEALEVFRYEAVMACMEHCVAACIKALQNLQEGRETPEPEQYYVPVRNW